MEGGAGCGGCGTDGWIEMKESRSVSQYLHSLSTRYTLGHIIIIYTLVGLIYVLTQRVIYTIPGGGQAGHALVGNIILC